MILACDVTPCVRLVSRDIYIYVEREREREREKQTERQIEEQIYTDKIQMLMDKNKNRVQE